MQHVMELLFALLLGLTATCWPAAGAQVTSAGAEDRHDPALMRRPSEQPAGGMPPTGVSELEVEEEEEEAADEEEEEENDEEEEWGAASAAEEGQGPLEVSWPNGTAINTSDPAALNITGTLGFVSTTTTESTTSQTSTEAATTTSTTTTACADRARLDAPIITVNGEALDCPSLKRFCVGHPKSEYVVVKCPLTCSTCQGLPVTTTTKPPRNSDSREHGCSRRRRWGFCYTRRRRAN